MKKAKLRNRLYPLYADMLANITQTKDVYPFCIQWGENFPTEQNIGILFVGKATNGWVTQSKDVAILFGETKEKVFNVDDQMQWVENLQGNQTGYNTNKSSFWRLIHKVTDLYYGASNRWTSQIAWSNLYKVSHESGNPNAEIKNEQHEFCQQILQAEIEVLSPKFVIFLTSGWETDFLYFLNGNNSTKSIYKGEWAGYKIKAYYINGIIYICTQHPQGKPEEIHAEAIYEIMKKQPL